jgi:Tol biopolymer transport system component
MRPDGSNLERMTGDEGVNWFPHPSPDGKRVVYLAYEGAAGGHPANRDVELRMMPASGGKAEVLVSLFGGQGTINVPGWAPGSKRFTFVHHGK